MPVFTYTWREEREQHDCEIIVQAESRERADEMALPRIGDRYYSVMSLAPSANLILHHDNGDCH
jgi:hypothetical protein